jgi:NitT/TauT family transport system substrate-binding protein
MGLAAVTALALSACGGSSPTATQASSAPIKLVVSYSEIYEGSLPLWLTADAGLFQKHGLEVELQYIASATSIAALTAGQTQISQGGGSEALSATVGGADLVVIGNLVPVYPYVFEVPASIKSLNDLKGKKVGVSAAGSQSDIATRAGLARVGLVPDKDVIIVPVGSSQNRTAALQNGSIQGGLDQPPYSIILERSGFHPLFDLASLRLPTVNNGIVVQRSFLNGHKTAVQGYIDALVEGLARLRKDRTFAVGVLKKWLKLDDEPALNATYDFAVGKLFPVYPHITAEHMADAVDVLSQKNPRVKDFDVKRMLDDSFVKSAADRRVGA